MTIDACLLERKSVRGSERFPVNIDSINNGGFARGCKGVWVQEKGECALIWLKFPHKL